MDFNLGDIIEVTVTGIENYGIFVSVNDEYTGLIHISEIDNNFVEDSRMNPSEKVGVVSVVFVSTDEEKIKNKLKKLQDKNPEKFYMEYVTPLDVDLTSLEHYPSIEISKNDLQ